MHQNVMIHIMISQQTWLSYNATQLDVNRLLALNDEYYSPYNPPTNDTFGSNMTTSLRFIYTVLLSYVVSVFITQPLIIFIKTLLKYRKYSKQEYRNKIFGEHLLFGINGDNVSHPMDDTGCTSEKIADSFVNMRPMQNKTSLQDQKSNQ